MPVGEKVIQAVLKPIGPAVTAQIPRRRASRKTSRRASIAKKSIPSTRTSTPSSSAPTFSGVTASGKTCSCSSGLIARASSAMTSAFPRPEGADRGAELAVEVGELEAVGVGDVERADAQAGEGDEVDSPDPSHPDDRHPAAPEPLLLLWADEPAVAGEGPFVGEGAGGRDRAELEDAPRLARIPASRLPRRGDLDSGLHPEVQRQFGAGVEVDQGLAEVEVLVLPGGVVWRVALAHAGGDHADLAREFLAGQAVGDGDGGLAGPDPGGVELLDEGADPAPRGVGEQEHGLGGGGSGQLAGLGVDVEDAAVEGGEQAGLGQFGLGQPELGLRGGDAALRLRHLVGPRRSLDDRPLGRRLFQLGLGPDHREVVAVALLRLTERLSKSFCEWPQFALVCWNWARLASSTAARARRFSARSPFRNRSSWARAIASSATASAT